MGLHKMSAMLPTTFSNAYSWIKIIFSFKFHCSYFHMVQFSVLALVLVMDWRRVSVKPIPEPMVVAASVHQSRPVFTHCGRGAYIR